MIEVINASFLRPIFFFFMWLNLLLRILVLHLSQYIIFPSIDVFITQEVSFLLFIRFITSALHSIISFFVALNADPKVAHGKIFSVAISNSKIS